MNVLNRDILFKAAKKHADAKKQLDAWYGEVMEAGWNGPSDIKQRYASASLLANNVVIFNIRGNKYRLIAKVNYPAGVVLVKWFGPHAAYDKLDIQSL